MELRKLKSELREYSDKEQAKVLQRFFKTGPGEYAEGDIFIGVKVPVLRALARQYQDIEFSEALVLLKSAIHEERLLALFILIIKYRKAGLPEKENIYKSYLEHTKYINSYH